MKYQNNVVKLGLLSNLSSSNSSGWTSLSNVKYIKLNVWVISDSLLTPYYWVEEGTVRSDFPNIVVITLFDLW